MIKKVISGGQTGADQGGLLGARDVGVETGGTAPHNWMTSDGPQEELLKSFGLIPGPYDPKTWPVRTKCNVQDSDGTVIFGNVRSYGSQLTYNLCTKLGKPVIINPLPEILVEWVRENEITILNVAGNRESKNCGIQERVRKIIKITLLLLKENARFNTNAA